MRKPCSSRSLGALALLAASLGAAGGAAAQQSQTPTRWKQHDMTRPRPQAVVPPAQSLPAPVPADAVVLFGGGDLERWQKTTGGAAPWKVENGYFQVVPGTGAIQSKDEFGDVQLHVEWASPNPPQGTGQNRGNSGVFLMNRYEIQVLDSHQAETYADGQAGAIYGQHPPLFNATRAPGEWQAYDIFFRRPRFSATGKLLEPARVTVLHNGILIQNNEEIQGLTTWLKSEPYRAHGDKAPIQLQDHGHPVRFRNIWARPLPERPAPGPTYGADERPVTVPAARLDRLVGTYSRGDNGPTFTIRRQGGELQGDNFFRSGITRLIPISPTEFVIPETAGRVVFQLDASGRPTGLVFHMGGGEYPARRVR